MVFSTWSCKESDRTELLSTHTEDRGSDSDGKEPTCQAGDPGSVPGLGRSRGEGNGCPLPCSGLDIPWTEEPGLPR